MDRRNLLTGGLCLLGGGCGATARGRTGNVGERRAPATVPANPTVRNRTFDMALAPFYKRTLHGTLRWLEGMLHRLGRDATLALWHEAFRTPNDGLLAAILAKPWKSYEDRDEETKLLDERIESCFLAPVEGVSRTQAHDLALMAPTIRLPVEKLPSLYVRRRVTAYDALHLRFDAEARVAETMKSRLGKEGELVAYDICRAGRVDGASTRAGKVTAADVLKEWADVAPAEESLFSAGLNAALIKQSPTEVVVHITECEWARYFRERHPTVGYVLACSTDDADLRATTDKLWLQRTSTLMEGGRVCDFRVYEG
jgi:hypothetical protein